MPFNLRFWGALGALSLLCHCDISAPSQPTAVGSDKEANGMQLQLFTASAGRVALAQHWNMDSLVLTLSEADTIRERDVIVQPTETISLPALATGAQRRLVLTAFRDGIALFAGEVNITMDPNRKQPIQLVLHPLFGRIQVAILLPALDEPVFAGKMKVTSESGNWQGTWTRRGSLGTLSLDTLPIGRGYRVEIELSDSLQNVLYTGAKDSVGVLAGQDNPLEVGLTPTRVHSTLSVQWRQSTATQVTISVPGQKRAVQKPGDLVWTKVYPIPSPADSGASGEWVEIFNTTSDTLELNTCKVTRDRLSGDTRGFSLDGYPPLAPGMVITFGHTQSPAEYLKNSFSLVNTSTTLWLECGVQPLVQDTVRYSSTQDSSAVFVREGEILLRRPTHLGEFGNPKSWCTQVQDSLPSGKRVGPGSILTACGES
jgi:hypothetical protein